MGDHAGQAAVVGEEKQTLGVDVEPSDGDNAGQILRQIVEHGRTALGVARGGHEPAGLVIKPEARALLRWKRLAIDRDLVGGRHVDGGRVQDLAVEGDAAFGDHRLDVAAGRDSGPGDNLGDPILGGLVRLRVEHGLAAGTWTLRGFGL